jgi:hypothetical protein
VRRSGGGCIDAIISVTDTAGRIALSTAITTRGVAGMTPPPTISIESDHIALVGLLYLLLVVSPAADGNLLPTAFLFEDVEFVLFRVYNNIYYTLSMVGGNFGRDGSRNQ